MVRLGTFGRLSAVVLVATTVLAPIAVSAAPECFGKAATIVGTSGDDVLIGTSGNDVIVGRGGNDRLVGKGGNDRICGGAGDDELLGGAGRDRLDGGAGSDVLAGGNGRDQLSGGPGADTIDGNSGADTVDYKYAGTTGFSVDLEKGTAAPSSFGSSPALLDGDSDTLIDIENVNGTLGIDDLWGDDGPNVLRGRGGTDFLIPRRGDDTLRGGSPGEGNFVDYSDSSKPVRVNLAKGSARGSGKDKLVNITGAFGSPFDDSLRGDSGPNLLAGGSGDDVLIGKGGPDLLAGENGSDSLHGGAGSDTADYFFSPVRTSIDLEAGAGTDDGSDLLDFMENVIGSRFNDRIFGTFGDNRLDGGAGNDQIFGLGGDDELIGGSGSDELDGGGGTDTCTGGEVTKKCEIVNNVVPAGFERYEQLITAFRMWRR